MTSLGALLDSRFGDIERTLAGLQQSPPTSSPPLNSVGNDFVNIASKGAVGDGISDDYLKLQAVLDTVGQAGGGSVYVGRRYAVSQSLSVYPNTRLFGVGTILPSQNFVGNLANNNCYLVKNKNWSDASVVDKNITIDGITFDYGNLTLFGGGLHAISIRHAENVRAVDCTFFNGEDAVAFLGCNNTKIYSCSAYGFINCAWDHWSSPKNASVSNCYAETANAVQMVNFNPDNTTGVSAGNVADGLTVTGSTFIYKGQSACANQIEPLAAGQAVKNVVFDGNRFVNSYLAMRGHVANVAITNNSIDNVGGDKNAILVQALHGVRPYHFNVSGNIISSATTKSANLGVITLQANRYICANNVVGSGAFYVALYAQDGDGIAHGNNFATGTSGQKQIGVNSSGT